MKRTPLKWLACISLFGLLPQVALAGHCHHRYYHYDRGTGYDGARGNGGGARRTEVEEEEEEEIESGEDAAPEGVGDKRSMAASPAIRQTIERIARLHRQTFPVEPPLPLPPRAHRHDRSIRASYSPDVRRTLLRISELHRKTFGGASPASGQARRSASKSR